VPPPASFMGTASLRRGGRAALGAAWRAAWHLLKEDECCKVWSLTSTHMWAPQSHPRHMLCRIVSQGLLRSLHLPQEVLLEFIEWRSRKLHLRSTGVPDLIALTAAAALALAAAAALAAALHRRRRSGCDSGYAMWQAGVTCCRHSSCAAHGAQRQPPPQSCAVLSLAPPQQRSSHAPAPFSECRSQSVIHCDCAPGLQCIGEAGQAGTCEAVGLP